MNSDIIYAIVLVASMILWMFLAFKIASKKGRDKWLAVILAFLFGLWTVLGYCLVRAKNVVCPICGSVTELRVAKGGENKGKKYHVCVGYPQCKGRVKA